MEIYDMKMYTPRPIRQEKKKEKKNETGDSNINSNECRRSVYNVYRILFLTAYEDLIFIFGLYKQREGIYIALCIYLDPPWASN